MTPPDSPPDIELLKELDQSDCLLYRQVHPTYVVDDMPNELAFRCTEADHGELSIAHFDKVTPQAACEARHAAKPGSTAGTWAVSVREVQDVGLRAWDDTARPSVDDPAHGFIDYRPVVDDKVRRRTVSKLLAERAANRYCLYRLA